MLERRFPVCLIYGYGVISDASTRINRQTRARCRRAAALYHKGKIRRIFIAAGGEPVEGLYRHETMGDYLVKLGVRRSHISYNAYGTDVLTETQIYTQWFRWLKKEQAAYFMLTPTTVCSWYMAPRVWWCLAWHGIFVRPRITFAGTRIVDLAREVVKLPAALILYLPKIRNWYLHRKGVAPPPDFP